MFIYTRETFFFVILQLLQRNPQNKECKNMRYPSVLAASSLLRCMFLTHKNTVNHYYVSTLSPHDNFQLNNTFFSHSQRQNRTAAGIFLFKCDSFNSGAVSLCRRIARRCARLVAGAELRPLAGKNLFIYWWSERSSEWENWVTASAQQQLTPRGCVVCKESTVSYCLCH